MFILEVAHCVRFTKVIIKFKICTSDAVYCQVTRTLTFMVINATNRFPDWPPHASNENRILPVHYLVVQSILKVYDIDTGMYI